MDKWENPMNIIYWLVVWNMAFIFHNMNGSSFPLTNSYFSRWLKPPTRFHMEKTLREMPVSKTSHMVERMSLLGYFVYFVFLQNFEVIPRSSFYEETTCSAEIHRNSLAGLWSKIRLKSYQQIEFASQQELHWYTMVYMIIHTHTYIYNIHIY